MHTKKTIVLSVLSLFLFAFSPKAEALDILGGLSSDSLVSQDSLDLDGVVGGLLDFGGTLGIGNINVTCSLPSFNIPGLDTCSLSQALSLDNLLPSLDFSIGGCSLSVGYGNGIAQCQDKLRNLGCGDNAIQINLGDLASGLGGNTATSSKYLALMGERGIFGKDLCSDDPKRYQKMNSPASRQVYGTDGWTRRALFDKEIGGNPSFMNKRRTSKMLKCAEAAIETGQSTDQCLLNNPSPGSEKSPAEIEDAIVKSAKYDMGMVSDKTEGKTGDKVDKYWKLFHEKAKARGVEDWKLLMAIGMYESGLDPTYDGASKADGTRDYGMMQINSKHKDKVNEWYGSYGGLGQALHVPDPSVDYAAHLLKECGTGWESVTCYGNNDPAYLAGVKLEYMKIANRDFGTPEEPYKEDVKISDRAAAGAALSFTAVQHKNTMTHLGKDTIDLLPVEKKGRYIQMVNRYMAQQTLILAAYKKASDIEKALYHVEDYSGAVSSGSTGVSSGATPAAGATAGATTGAVTGATPVAGAAATATSVSSKLGF